MKTYLTFVASDEMEGRDTPSRGLDITAMYIASHLERWGLKPGGDNGGWFQKIPLIKPRIDTSQCAFNLSGKDLVYGEDFICEQASGDVSGKLVYGGSGWYAKSNKLDAYAGLNVKGKIVVLNQGYRFAPPGLLRSELKGTPGVDFMDPVAYAKNKGALGIIYIFSKSGLSNWAQSKNRFEGGSAGYRMEGKPVAATATNFPIIYASENTAKALFDSEKLKLENIYSKSTDEESLASFAFTDVKTATIRVKADMDRRYTQNVIGIVEGSDPVLKNEFVAVSAHYDHIGMNNRPGAVDKVYNGADDDGSGTVSILSMAEALATSAKKPKRSVVFIWHCGEEKGLWGSEYYTSNPTIPLAQIITDLNIDMIGRSKLPGDTKASNRVLTGPNEIYVIGSKMQSTQLGEVSERVNYDYLKLGFNYKYDDPADMERIFYRSDHYNYARKGIPIIFYFDGVHEDYHGLGDEVSKIDFVKMEKVVRTVYMTMWELTGLPKRPIVDKKIP